MTAIELKRILKDGALILVVLAALVLAIITSDQDAYLAPALEMFLLLNASFLGWSMFERERQENATEYMLTLPVSRTRLLLQKFLPRLAAAALLLLLYLFLHQGLRLPSFLEPRDFTVLYAGFFLLSASFAVSLKNFLSAFFLTCLLLVGQVLLVLGMDNSMEIRQAVLQASLAAAAVPVWFFCLFQRFDVRPVPHFNLRFFPGLLLIAILAFGGIWLRRPTYWNNYFITRDGTLIRNSCQRSELLPRPAGSRIDSCLLTLREDERGGFIYGLIQEPRKEDGCLPLAIVTVDLKSGALKTIYRIPAGWFVAEGYPGEVGTERDGAYLLLLRHAEQKKALVLELDGRGAKTVPLPGELPGEEIEYAGFLSRAPLSMLIIGKGRAYMLFGDGRRQEIAAAEGANVWRDRILVFNSTGMSLFQVGARPLLLWQSAGQFRKVLRHISGFESRFVLYRSEGKHYLLDMERPESTPLEMRSTPFTYQQRGDDLFIVFVAGSRYEIWRRHGGRIDRDAWDPGFNAAGIRISPFGILAFDRQRYEVHPFKQD